MKEVLGANHDVERQRSTGFGGRSAVSPGVWSGARRCRGAGAPRLTTLTLFMTGAKAFERRDEKGFDVAGFRLLLSVSRARGAVELKNEDGPIWVWSDLHGRPFRSVVEMDDVLFERWRSSVRRPGASMSCAARRTRTAPRCWC